MAGIENVERLYGKLRKLEERFEDASVAVGYAAAYALALHERRAAKWKGRPRRSGIGRYWGPNGRPGFLLDVAREMRDELAGIVAKALSRGATVGKALLLAGLALQRASQRNVPVEYGNLRASAFTRLERGST